MTSNPSPDRWRNVDIRIVCPVPDDGYDPHEDRRLDDLVDTVMDLFPQAVLSTGLVWSDADDAA